MADDTFTDDDRRLIEATCDALQLEESAKTAMLASTHAPIGTGGSNWITKSKPGNTGQLPAYIQNVRNAIMRDGTEESKATEIAIGKVRDWAEGKGNVGPEVKAAAAKAIAEFDKMRASSKVRETARPRASRRVPSSGAADDPLAIMVEVPDMALVETKANPGVTRWGHPVVASKLPGNVSTRKPRRTRTGVSSQYDAGKHPRGRGGEWTVKQGDNGDVVRVVQRRVGAKADGQYGAGTRQSVMDFQRKHGLKVDGVVGRQTIAAMRGDTNALHVMPGAATLADRRWLHARAAMRRIRETPGARPAARPRPAPLPSASGVLALKVGDDLKLVETPDLEIHEEQPLALVETALTATGGHGASTAVDLSLIEAANGEVQFNPDGSVDFALIRPCLGRGVGSRIYTPQMLRENAHVPAGLVMYDSHESPAAKRARQGLPRPPSELCGQVLESWWDPSFTTPDDGKFEYGPGAIIGRCMLTEDAEKLVKRLPRAVKVSVNMEASGMRASSMGGKRGMLVEGLVGDPDRHSIDLVTTAGAGGAVASLYRDMVPA